MELVELVLLGGVGIVVVVVLGSLGYANAMHAREAELDREEITAKKPYGVQALEHERDLLEQQLDDTDLATERQAIRRRIETITEQLTRLKD